MNRDRLIPERCVSFDTETHLIQPGILAPPLVCASYALIVEGKIHGALLDRNDARVLFERLLRDESYTIVGQNIAYDFLVMAVDAAKRGIDLMPLIFAAYRAGRVYDIGIAETLHAIAEGTLGKDPRTGGPLKDPITGKPSRYSLSTVTYLVLGRTDAKENDEWRLRYAELEDVPISEWPYSARQYPVDDSVNTLEDAIGQMTSRPIVREGQATVYGPNRNLHDLAPQVFKAFALHLGAAWGIRTDPAAVEALSQTVARERAEGLPEFIAAGFVRPDGSENQAAVKRAVALAYGCSGSCAPCNGTGKLPSVKTGKPVNCPTCNGTALDLLTSHVPRTEPTPKMLSSAAELGVPCVGNVQIGRDVLIESGDERLMHYGAFQEDDKIESTYLPFLRLGVDRPICLRPNAVLDTGRVSYSDPSQTFPRQLSARLILLLEKSGAPITGVRDCCVPRLGWVYYSNDYSGGELVTFSESAKARVGYSRMGESLNRGLDVHSGLGATMMGVSYDEFVRRLKVEKSALAKAFRQAAKPANFGFPGGMGAVTLVLAQRKQGPDTEWPDGPTEIRPGVRGYKGLRFCLLVGGKTRCGEVKVTEWGRPGYERPCPPTCRACIETAEQIRDAWFRQWPESGPYLKWHGDNVNNVGEVIQHYSRRVRGGVDFCSEANGDFQALLADIAGRAQCRVSFEQYVRSRVEVDPIAQLPSRFEGAESPLFGVSRSILFAHDELFGEAVESVAAEVSERVNEIMIEEFVKGCPNHRAACKAEPTLMRRWFKAAEPVRDASGRLIPWEPKRVVAVAA